MIMSTNFPFDPATAIHDETIAARVPWSRVLKQGEVLHLIDLEGQQAVDALFYRADHFEERYSAQDTLRAQNSAYVTTGTKLLSNEGNVLMTVIADSCGRHDTSAGACSCEANTVRFGHHTRFMHACRENFTLELGKYGMSKRDIVSNVNFFMNVPIEPSGELAIVDGISAPGGSVTLKADMDVLVVFSNCPQVNNPCNGFNPSPVRVLIWAAA
jgi:urea carboxylase-associated protein 1